MAWSALRSAIEVASVLAGAALVVASCAGHLGSESHETVSAGGSVASTTTAMPPEPGADLRRRSGPHLVVPSVIDVPYVVAGQGGASATVEVENDGDAPLVSLAWMLSGDPSISLDAAPAWLAPGEKGQLVLTWPGSAAETIVQASLAVAAPAEAGPQADIPVFAVAGDPGLGSAAWEDVEGAGNVIAGTGATVAMPAAPFPDGTFSFNDASVRVFLPESYRDRGAHDLVLHFHGWNSTLASTLAQHLYQQHLYASGSNAVLVVPQGPVNAQSGDFGKLMQRGGVSRLLSEVLVLLYREGKIRYPVRGDLQITSHSGGYQAAVAALDPANQVPRIAQMNLFDSLYGYDAAFGAFALYGGFLRSNYSESGGTFDVNQALMAFFTQRGFKPAADPTQRALRDDLPVIHYAPTTHDGTTRHLGAYGEALRWKLKHSRRGPRIELREVVERDGVATARWLAPVDEDVTGFVVQASADGLGWATVAAAAASASDASFPLEAGARVRVEAVTSGVDPASALPSDTYRVDPAAAVLVVDGFDRVLDGAFGGLHHDFAAKVGETLGPVASISHRAVTEDGFDLTAWPTVVWLLGDQSTGDVSLTPAEQTALSDYVDGGGHLLVSGSELGFDIGQTPVGAAFLAHCFGAAFLSDDAGSHEVAGQGPLSEVASFAFGGPGAPYAAASPDALEAIDDGAVLLEYGSGKAAAVGLPGRAALVSFPLELCGSASQIAAVTRPLLSFVGAP